MAYRVLRLNPKREGSPKFRIRWEEETKGKNLQRVVKKPEWKSLGINPVMTFEEAREICKHLNSKISIKKQEARRNRIQMRLEQENLIKSAFLPEILTKEFEEKIVPQKRIDPVFWRTAKRVVAEVQLDPSEWSDYPERFYQYFEKRGLSIDYTRKVLRVLNAWGKFYSKKKQGAYSDIPRPITYQRERINDAYFEKNGGDNASKPLFPEDLSAKKNELDPEHYNWLFISVWFGLRPEEIDNLHEKNTWRLEKNGKVRVLHVYQPKLRGIPREKRWKLIPTVFPEQETALKLILSARFRRPLLKTLERVFGEGYYCYAGRKGFTDMMLNRGVTLPEIVAWLGHKNMNTTWEKYKNRLQLTYRRTGNE